ncbi:Clp protease N-terminal domain-containing protein [Calothrix sp. UHCC 0171]|uniref:Clp protease N-terminal domain-containing protein n=1 Tax=Calothrix sp. UHCC 0171 TaxID=3110245 RepID=UPI002B2136D6|nr:Clp protease N-terminal domain-containing protein [Calothrix sp. UHCC 0171]MEA5570045.1 Clp protease N-terminal domain-containing protein [Calothrix sp. UHCC 0171]
MFDDFSQEANQAILVAQQEARILNHHFVGVENLLLGLVEIEVGIASKILKSMGVDASKIRLEANKIIGRGSGIVGEQIPFTPSSKRILLKARQEAYQLAETKINTKHLLLALIRDAVNENNITSTHPSISIRILQNLAIDLDKLYQQIIDYRQTVKSPHQVDTTQMIVEKINKMELGTKDNQVNYLDKYAENHLLITSPLLEEKVKHLAMMLTGAKQLVAEIETHLNPLQFLSASDVLAAIHQSQNISENNQNFKDLLIRLHALVEAETKLTAEDISEARSQIVILAFASKKIGEDSWQRKANTAIKILIGTVVQRPLESHQLAEYRMVLPAISKLLTLR